MTISEGMREGSARLAQAGIDTARLDTELLLGHVLGWDRARLYTYPEASLTPEQESRWRSLLERRISREPLPYLLGEWEFYGRRFKVTPATLIPRPETELLIDGLLRHRLGAESGPALGVDVGTGSGCIGLTLAAEAPAAIMVLTDLSSAALAVAKENAARLGLEKRVEFRHAAFPAGLDDLEGRLDVLVSNPPYVAERDRGILPPEVEQFEPQEALFSGDDGLNLLRLLLERGRSLLKPGGWIALEFGIGQADALRQIAEGCGYRSLSLEADLAGLPRALFAQAPP